jgi:type II secretory pathway pseudopilin PulG
MRLTRDRQRGDTIIEVLFAITVFAMVAVGSLSIMNQGTGSAQRSLEVTLVREQIDAQAEAIRFIHQAYVTSYQADVQPSGTAAEWTKMKALGKENPSAFGNLPNNQCLETAPDNAFVLNARRAEVSTATVTMRPLEGSTLPPFAQVAYDDTSNAIDQAYGIWVEVVPSAASEDVKFVDFHIRACWDSPGATIPVTLGTIVRLYEPN